MKRTIFTYNLLLVIFLYACSSSSLVTNDISVAQLKEAMKTDSVLVVLDVRKPSELTGELGHIEGAVNIPLDELEDRINELSGYKKDHIAVICRSGNRSKKATALLTDYGYNASNVLGGMKAFLANE